MQKRSSGADRKKADFVFGIPFFRYWKDPTELRQIAEQKYKTWENYPINDSPSGWDCSLRTEFNVAHENYYEQFYDDVMVELAEDLGLDGHRCYIDESWLNYYTDPNHSQEEHDHLPGYFSAIHYIKINPEVHGGTIFTNPLAQMSSYMNDGKDYKEYSGMNSETWTPEVISGDIIVFPSFLKHRVNHAKTSESRITLAFNINTIKGSSRRVFGR